MAIQNRLFISPLIWLLAACVWLLAFFYNVWLFTSGMLVLEMEFYYYAQFFFLGCLALLIAVTEWFSPIKALRFLVPFCLFLLVLPLLNISYTLFQKGTVLIAVIFGVLNMFGLIPVAISLNEMKKKGYAEQNKPLVKCFLSKPGRIWTIFAALVFFYLLMIIFIHNYNLFSLKHYDCWNMFSASQTDLNSYNPSKGELSRPHSSTEGMTVGQSFGFLMVFIIAGLIIVGRVWIQSLSEKLEKYFYHRSQKKKNNIRLSNKKKLKFFIQVNFFFFIKYQSAVSFIYVLQTAQLFMLENIVGKCPY